MHVCDSTGMAPNCFPCGTCRIRCDDSLTILQANEYFYRLYGYTPEEAEGAGFISIGYINYPADWQEVRKTVTEGIGGPEACFELETRAIRNDGEILWVFARGERDPEKPEIANCVVLDITQRMEILGHIRRECAVRDPFGKSGNERHVFRFYLADRTAVLSQDTARELGLPERVENLPESLADRYPAPESREDFINFYNRMLRGEQDGSVVLHFKNGTGLYTWYHCNFSMITDRNGVPTHTLVSFEDISEQRERELAYEKWSQYNKNQLENAIVYYECDLTRNILELVEGTMAYQLPTEATRSYDKVLHYVVENCIFPQDRELYWSSFGRDEMLRRYQGGKREFSVECRRLNQEGQPFWTCVSVQLLPDPYSEDIKAFVLVKNIDEEKRRQLELQLRSQTDALTGLLNRSTVIERINQLLQNSSPSDRHAFLMVDIDGFKGINDRLGHQFGDRVLLEIAGVLKASLRSEDVIGRLGGDEFVICLKNMPLNSALEQKANALCGLLSRHFDEDAYISGSLGVAVYPKDGVTFDDLYRNADIALYEAKRRGRNRYVFFQANMDPGDGRPHANTPIDPVEENGFMPLEQELDLLQFGPPSELLEQTQNEAMMTYISALHGLYDDVLVMDVLHDHYQSLHRLPGKHVFLPDRGDLQKALEIAAERTVHPDDIHRFHHFFDWREVAATMEAGAQSRDLELRWRKDSGGYSWISLTLILLPGEIERKIYACLVRDIDRRKREIEAAQETQMRLRQQIEDECYRTIMELSGMTLLENNEDNGSYYFSPSAQNFSFHGNLVRKHYHAFLRVEDVHPEDWPEVEQAFLSIRHGNPSVKLHVRLRKTDGSYLWCRVLIVVLKDDEEEIHRSLVMISDIDESVRDRRALEYRAEYDDLTGYYNFSRFKADAAKILERRGNSRYSLWYSDLRNFKLVNDMFGYDFGDRILKYWADVLAEECGEGEIFARVSADHFVSLRRYESRDELRHRFYRSVNLLSGYEELQDKKLRLELDTGIYCVESEEDLLRVEEMIDRANLAQKSVKNLDGSRLAFYSKTMREKLIREKEIAAVMHEALGRGEFVGYLQPLACAGDDGTICGAEVLARWDRPGHGLLTPAQFIPLFEKNGFIVELDLCLFEQACQYLRRWIDRGERPIRLSVNVSQVSVVQPNFAANYISCKESYGIPNGLLELECTETTAAANTQLLESLMKQMREAGFRFAMDDFGSGYSSLNLLKNVTTDVLKLDMTFFQKERLTEPRNRTIVSHIVAMAKELAMEVVAEGTETLEQIEAARGFGCDILQGYYFGRPMPVADFERQMFQYGNLQEAL